MYRITVSPHGFVMFFRPGATALTGAMAGAISTEPGWSIQGDENAGTIWNFQLLVSQCGHLVTIGDAVDGINYFICHLRGPSHLPVGAPTGFTGTHS